MARRIKGASPSVVAEYRRQRRRVQSFVNRAEKRGYSFGDFEIPEIPQNVTEASVRRLARLTPDVLYKKSTHYDYDSANKEMIRVKGEQYRKKERQKAAIKSAFTRQHNAWRREHGIDISEDTRRWQYDMSDEEYDRYTSQTQVSEQPEEPDTPWAGSDFYNEVAKAQAQMPQTIEPPKPIEPEPAPEAESPEDFYNDLQNIYDNVVRIEDIKERIRQGDYVSEPEEVAVEPFSIIENISSRLGELPEGTYVGKDKYIEFGSRNNAIIDIFNEKVAEHMRNGTLDQYVDYLNANQQQIFTSLDVIMYASDGEQIEYSFVSVAEAIKGAPLTATEAKRVEGMYDDVGDFEDNED